MPQSENTMSQIGPVHAGSVLRRRNDADLVRAARRGCSSSFAALVDRYSRPLLSFLYRRVGNRQEAEDLAQETFVRVYQNLDRYRSEARFSTWLFTIAANLAVSHRRKVFRRPSCEPLREVASIQPGPSRRLEQREQSERLWALAEELPESQRRVLELRYLAELSVRETARVMKKTPVHIKVLLYRARHNMARKLSCGGGAVMPETSTRSCSKLAGQGVCS